MRLNHLIATEDGNNLVWRKGVVLQHDQYQCRAQILEQENHEGLKIIDIAVIGEISQRKYLLHLIREEVHKIHNKWFKNIQAEQMIPCHCDYCGAPEQTDPKYFAFSVLERAQQRGKQTVECDKDFRDVSVLSLLEGVFSPEEIAGNRMEKEIQPSSVHYNFHGSIGTVGGIGDNNEVEGDFHQSNLFINPSEKNPIKPVKEDPPAVNATPKRSWTTASLAALVVALVTLGLVGWATQQILPSTLAACITAFVTYNFYPKPQQQAPRRYWQAALLGFTWLSLNASPYIAGKLKFDTGLSLEWGTPLNSIVSVAMMLLIAWWSWLDSKQT